MAILEFKTPEGIFFVDSEKDRKYARTFSEGHYPEAESVILKLVFEKISSKSTVVDVGANIGVVSVPISRRVHLVHSFEPISESASRLKKNIAANNISNVIVHEYGLSNHNGSLDFFEEVDGQASTYRWSNSHKKDTSVEVKTLDSLNIECDFIKIDVQGMESLVIQGAQNTIMKNRPSLLFEVSKNSLEVPNRFQIIHNILTKYNFYIEINGQLGTIKSFWLTLILLMPGAFILGNNGTHYDVLAVSKDKTDDIKARGNLPTVFC